MKDSDKLIVTEKKMYTIRCLDGFINEYYTLEVEGEPIDLLEGFELFIHKNKGGGWGISEATSGRSVAVGLTRLKALAVARGHISRNKHRFREIIDRAIEENSKHFKS